MMGGDLEPEDSLEEELAVVEEQAFAFDAIEKEFQAVLHDLFADRSLDQFRQEYEKAYKAVKKSHESEKRLLKKCRELKVEIVNNAEKVQTALNLSQDDQATIESLKAEIARGWALVEASHEKDAANKKTLNALKAEILQLSTTFR